MPENSGPWSQARSPSKGQNFMAWRNVNVSFQGPEDFFALRNAKGLLPGIRKVPAWRNVKKVSMGGGKNVPVSTAGRSIFGNGISHGKLNQKGIFHSVDEFLS
jgi:hypothetical protein